MKKLNRNLTEEEKSSKWSKILSQVKVTVKRKRLHGLAASDSKGVRDYQFTSKSVFALHCHLQFSKANEVLARHSVQISQDSIVQYSTVRNSKLANKKYDCITLYYHLGVTQIE